MNDTQVDDLVAATAWPSDERVAAITATAPLPDLLEAILAAGPDTALPDIGPLDGTPHDPGPIDPGPVAGDEPERADAGMHDDGSEAEDMGDDGTAAGPGPWGRRTPRRLRPRALVAAVVVLLALLAGTLVVTLAQRDDPATEVWSSDALRVAEGVPTVLLPPGEWSVSDLVEFSVEQGEVRFVRSADGLEAELFWRPAETHEDYVEDREASAAGPSEPIEVTGREGVLVQYEGDFPDSTVLWRDGDHSLELRAPVLRDEMRSIAADLAEVDPNAWLAALPADVVRADDRAGVVAGMVADIPLPPAFDLGPLEEGGLAGGRYTVGVEVTQAVVCGWLQEWDAATQAGDTARADAAEAALATAADWAILHEMNTEGDWPEYIWEWSTAAASGTGIWPNGQPATSFCTNR